jgi:glycosyl transferase family 87
MSRAKWYQLGFVVLCAAWWLQKLVWTNSDNQWDFRVYYHAAQAWRAGLDPYDTATLPEALRTGGFKFNYPPYALGVFGPLTLLPLQRALLLYLALKVIVLAWLVQIWSRLLQTSITEPAWILFLIFSYSSTIFIDFASGSVTTFEQWLLWIGMAALMKERYWVYVMAVVGASLFRIAPILLLLVCLVAPDRRRYRYLAGGVAAFVCIFLLTYVVSPRLTVEFFESISKNFGERGRLNPALLPLVLDVTALIKRGYDVSLPTVVQAAMYLTAAAAVVVPTTFAVRRVARIGASNRIDVILYLVLLAYALVMPRFKNYHYMLLIVPTYYIATHSTRLRQAIPLLLLACLPIYSWITKADNLTLLANYSQWLIAFGAWALYLYELRGGALLVADS